MSEFRIEPHDVLCPTAESLIAALNAELRVVYPEEGSNHFRLQPAEVGPGRGAFLVAWLDGRAVGCGALRRLDDGAGELKRMYVAPELRGRGLGTALLAALEAEARRLACTRLVLETGARLAAAMALYRRHGFEPIERFGEYVNSPLSVCLGKELT